MYKTLQFTIFNLYNSVKITNLCQSVLKHRHMSTNPSSLHAGVNLLPLPLPHTGEL